MNFCFSLFVHTGSETTNNSSNDSPILLHASEGEDGKIEPTFFNLMKCVEKVVDWKRLAIHLLNDNCGSKTLQIECNYCDVRGCRTAMIREYLSSGNVSWQYMLKALRSAGYNDLATNVEKSLAIKVDNQGECMFVYEAAWPVLPLVINKVSRGSAH